VAVRPFVLIIQKLVEWPVQYPVLLCEVKTIDELIIGPFQLIKITLRILYFDEPLNCTGAFETIPLNEL